jgi:type IV pilus assembly protein PilF
MTGTGLTAGRSARPAALLAGRCRDGMLAAWTLVVVVTAIGLGACAGPAALPPDQPRAIPTVSDQTGADRRASTRLELASAYFGQGQTETALDEVKRALVANPNLAEAYNLRALIYAAMGEDRLAEDSFARALQINPVDGATLHNQAWFFCQRDRFGPAQAQFSAVLALPQYRDAARTQLARGVCYGRDKQWPEAEAALMRAYELEPANPAIGVSLAEILYQRQDFERARFYIGRVNDAPGASNAQTLWLAARIERKLGSESSSRQFGARLRERFPQSPEASLYERGRFDD